MVIGSTISCIMQQKREINTKQNGEQSIRSGFNLCGSIRKATNKVNLQLSASENG
jgi:hypothetical protein